MAAPGPPRFFCRLTNVFNPTLAVKLRNYVHHAAACGSTELVKHYENVNGVSKLTRVERFHDLPRHDACYSEAYWAIHDTVQFTLSVMCRQPMRLFKDKTNILNPGGGGSFVPHQDKPAFEPYGGWHVTAMVPLTLYNESTGAVRFASMDSVDDVVPMEELNDLTYDPVVCNPGDVVFFDSIIPHCSLPNTGNAGPRVGLYLTFVPETDPAWTKTMRDRYYRDKLEEAEGMSLNQVDFSGKIVQ